MHNNANEKTLLALIQHHKMLNKVNAKVIINENFEACEHQT